jgi:NIPSNAP
MLGLVFLMWSCGSSEPDYGSPAVLEIRTYTLKPGTRARFHQRFERESLPLLQRWKIDVVAYGPSLHDGDSYFLMRSFLTLAERDRVERAFYESAEWRDGPRAAVIADIESYNTLVINVDRATLSAFAA